MSGDLARSPGGVTLLMAALALGGAKQGEAVHAKFPCFSGNS
jgi:hypothetical protein